MRRGHALRPDPFSLQADSQCITLVQNFLDFQPQAPLKQHEPRWTDRLRYLYSSSRKTAKQCRGVHLSKQCDGDPGLDCEEQVVTESVKLHCKQQSAFCLMM